MADETDWPGDLMDLPGLEKAFPEALLQLTPREREIVRLLILGMTNRAIAGHLHIAEGTVKKLVYNCYQKLGVTSRVELMRLFLFGGQV